MRCADGGGTCSAEKSGLASVGFVVKLAGWGEGMKREGGVGREEGGNGEGEEGEREEGGRGNGLGTSVVCWRGEFAGSNGCSAAVIDRDGTRRSCARAEHEARCGG